MEPRRDDRSVCARRSFLRSAALGAGARRTGCGPSAASRAARPVAAPPAAATGFTAGITSAFPLLDARGTDSAIGRAPGRRFAAEIRGGFADRAAWFCDLKAFADSLPQTVVRTFVAAAKRHAPATALVPAPPRA